MRSGASSITGPREVNEDSFAYVDLRAYSDRLGGLQGFAVIADGMGGHAHGEVASRLAVEACTSYVNSLVDMTVDAVLAVDRLTALKEMIGEADAAIMSMPPEQGGGAMGATIVAVLLTGDRAWIGHVGDSRAYILRGRKAIQVTTDHSRVARMVADGVITEQQAQDHPMRNAIERALGFAGAEPDFNEVALLPGDALLLATDGLYTVLGPKELPAVAASGKTAEAAAAALTAAALKAGTDDNTTVLLVAPDWEGFRAVTVPPASLAQKLTGRQAAPQRVARRRRAQLTTLGVVAAVVIVVGVVLFVAMQGGSGGGGSALLTPTSGASTTVTQRTIPGGLTGSTTAKDPGPSDDLVWMKVADGVNIRSEPKEADENKVAEVEGTQTFQLASPLLEDGWYRLPNSILGDLKVEYQGVFDADSAPNPVYISQEKLKIVDAPDISTDTESTARHKPTPGGTK